MLKMKKITYPVCLLFEGPGTYAFGYDVEDPETGNVQYRQEEKHVNGTIIGSYGYVDADEKPVIVTYVADKNGYR